MTKVKIELECLKDLLKREPIVKVVNELPDKETADLNYIYVVPKEGEGKDTKAYVLRPDRSGYDAIDLTPQVVNVLGESYITVEKETLNENGDVTFTVKTNETLANLLASLGTKNDEQDGKLTNLTDRVVALEGKEDKDTIYNDTEVKQGIKANESAIQGVEGDLTALRTHTDSRLTALEEKVDNDTIYDDTELKGRVKALEDKPEPPHEANLFYAKGDIIGTGIETDIRITRDELVNADTIKVGDTVVDHYWDNTVFNTGMFKVVSIDGDNIVLNGVNNINYKHPKQELTLNGNELSISDGNSVTLPTTTTSTAKPTKVTSDSQGVTVTHTETEDANTYNVNINEALNNYYDKSKTYTKEEVNGLITKQEEKATDITVYKTSFKDKSKVKEGDYDTPISPRVTLTYSSSTGVGILKVDFMVVSGVPKGFIIAELPSDAPVPAELVESQVWVGNVSTSIWIDKGSRTIKISMTTNPEIFNKRIIISVPGIFKK